MVISHCLAIYEDILGNLQCQHVSPKRSIHQQSPSTQADTIQSIVQRAALPKGNAARHSFTRTKGISNHQNHFSLSLAKQACRQKLQLQFTHPTQNHNSKHMRPSLFPSPSKPSHSNIRPPVPSISDGSRLRTKAAAHTAAVRARTYPKPMSARAATPAIMACKARIQRGAT